MNKLIVCILCVIPCFCYAGEDSHEYWAVTSFSFRINEAWKLKIKEDFRFRGGDYSEQQNEVFFSHTVSETFNYGLGLRQVHKENSSGEWRRENRPYAEFTLRNKLYGLIWSDRNRLEFRDFEDKKNVLRYRNRLKLSSPHDLFKLPLRPYIANEIFVQEESGYNRNRIYTGLVWDVTRKLDIDFFYIYQRDKGHGWDDLSIVGLEMIFSF